MDIHQAKEIEGRARSYQHHIEMADKLRIDENRFVLERINGEIYPVGVVKQVYNILADYHKEQVEHLGKLLDSIP